MKLATFFAGAGGLDLGFSKAGFDIIWANEYDKDIWETYEKNHENVYLDRRSITNIPTGEVPDCDGIIGGPPCQSWSEAGALRGIGDKRGQLFYDFIRILADKQPKFFLAENVSGMLMPVHKEALENIKNMFKECGYTLSFQMLNASDYGVPQDRKRVFFVGYRSDLGIEFEFPKPTTPKNKISLKEAIGDLTDTVLPAVDGHYANGDKCIVPNHEYMTGGFSSIFMSRNRVRHWDEVSFTIQAGGRHAPIHPQAPKMQLVSPDIRVFVPEQEHLYRRLSVRECARIQTFPDDFHFFYKNIAAGYKMIGNAVPVHLAYVLAEKIYSDLAKLQIQAAPKVKRWERVVSMIEPNYLETLTSRKQISIFETSN
ncbi:MAG: DNA cytosine methyltransferase [Saprospiraceae bacterium]|nr:DNA cytosine methyltransferase [Saprospiraceae bacterium]